MKKIALILLVALLVGAASSFALAEADKPFAASPNRITVPSVSPDPKTVEEKKPFVSGVKQREDKTYTAKEKKEGKNPLLTPRQGIKEEVHDDE